MSDVRVTQILDAISRGDAGASDRLLPMVYEELRSLAARQMGNERSGQTLQATALVHEAYLRLVDGTGLEPRWDSRGHFFVAAAEAMRRIMIDRARAKGAIKRGGGRKRIALCDLPSITDDAEGDLLDLDDALGRLEAEDSRKAELVKLRFYAGLSLSQAAMALGISESTADRDWAYARAWLYSELADGQAGGR